MSQAGEMQIKELITNYAKADKTNYAILIDGEWGCGKTYFVKNSIVKNDTTPDIMGKTPIYIPLYGLCSCDEIMKLIWLEAIPFKDKYRDLTESKAGSIAKALFMSGLGFFNIDKPEIDYENLMSLDKYILFFDDLERCDINRNKVLGFINNFVEHNGVKVVLIANQNEIGKKILEENIELKYFLSTRNEIGFPEVKAPSNTGLRTQKTSGITVDELNSRVDFLFGRSNEFLRIKEKLIGITVKYTPDIDSLLDNLINDYVLKVHRGIVNGSRATILSRLQNNNCNNLRTLIFALERYNVLASEINRMRDKYPIRLIEQVLFEVLEYTLEVSIKHKMAGYIQPWEQNSEYGHKQTRESILSMSTIFGFRFVYDFILYAKYDSIHIEEVISSYLKIIDRNDALYNLKNNWWNMEQPYVQTLMDEVLNKLELNSYIGQDLLVIIAVILNLNAAGFNFDVDSCLEQVLNNIESLSIDNLQIDRFYTAHSIREEILEEYKMYSDRIKKKIDERLSVGTSDHVNSFFDAPIIEMDKFREYVNENKYITFREAFLSKIDISALFKCIKRMTPKDIGLLRNSIYDVYSTNVAIGYYEADKKSIDELVRLLNDYLASNQCNDKIKTYVLSLLIKDIESYFEKFNSSKLNATKKDGAPQ